MKVIFLDIDGTLTEPGKNTPPDSAVLAIRKAREAGNKVFLCTGRNYGMLKPLLAYEFDGLIASSGGYVEVGGEVIYNRPFTEDETVQVMGVLAENGIFRTVECKDGSFTDYGLKEFLRAHAGENGNSELLRWREQIESSLGIRPMGEYEEQPVYKVVLMALSMEALKNVKKTLDPASFNVCIQEANGQSVYNGELISSCYDKGQAVKRVCEYLGCPIEDSYGFGDSMNDLEMVEAVGTSVVMENGSEMLKKMADLVAPAYDQDGILKAFEICKLIG